MIRRPPENGINISYCHLSTVHHSSIYMGRALQSNINYRTPTIRTRYVCIHALFLSRHIYFHGRRQLKLNFANNGTQRKKMLACVASYRCSKAVFSPEAVAKVAAQMIASVTRELMAVECKPRSKSGEASGKRFCEQQGRAEKQESDDNGWRGGRPGSSRVRADNAIIPSAYHILGSRLPCAITFSHY